MENNRNNTDTRFKQAADKSENENFPQMESIWNLIEQKLEDNKQRRIIPWHKYAGIAAILLLCLTMGTYIFSDNSNAPDIPENKITTIDYKKIKQSAEPLQTDTILKEEVVVVYDSVRRFFTSGLKKSTAAKRYAVKNKKRNNLVSGNTHKRINHNSYIPLNKIKSSINSDSIIDNNVAVGKAKSDQDILKSLQGYVPGIKVDGLMPFVNDTNNTIDRSQPGNVTPMYIAPGNATSNNAVSKPEYLPFKTVNKKGSKNNDPITPEEQFMADFNNKTLKLYVLGGIAAVITAKDNEFAKKSGFTYYDFGCLAPADITYYEKYNHLVLGHLKLNLKKGWQKEMILNTIGFQSWKEKQ